MSGFIHICKGQKHFHFHLGFLHKLKIFHHNETSLSTRTLLLTVWKKMLLYFSVSARCNECERVFTKMPSLPRGADTLEIEIVTVRVH